MSEPARPLSPFLHYRWRYTNTLSILHRITGLLLSVGLLLLACWLMAVAGGPRAYARASAVFSLTVFKLVYAGLLVAFCYHLVAGIRHLVWDTGRGLERETARRSARLVVAIVIMLVLGLGYFAFARGHAP
jgi:succinate dehydrogenase / fumarate reductase cytochrome b subunit